ncbi:glycosyltransferase family 2 protein [Methylotenera versatilis]|uniref:glycosyltransferase family 2 protein n=1 Tax=Methylotenera versatilis TaxID=1055487 RepID=UPI0006893604|nr:glycosyltransferase family 2 protein [Methylotenera versatilis]
MNKLPTFTIIIAVYNADKTLQKCIDSVVSQNFSRKQLIIIDGNSTDNSIEIIKKNSQSISYWISEPDTGIYNAWNKGLVKAEGEWIYFLGADDYFIDMNILDHVNHYLNEIPQKHKVVYGQVKYISTSGNYLYTRGEPWEVVGRRYKQLMTIPHQGVFQHKSLFVEHGNFDESFKIAGDYEFLLRELKTKAAFFIPLPIAYMTQDGVGSKTSNSLTIINELRIAQKKNQLIIPGPFWFFALVRVYIRTFIWQVLGEDKARKLLDVGRLIMKKPRHWTKNV